MANGYRTQFQTIQDILTSQGYDMSVLTDPGSLYGYGASTPYGKFFRPFDVSGYQQAQQALMQQESTLLADVGQQFSQATTALQTQFGSTMGKLSGEAGVSGLVSGAQQRVREQAYETGMEQFSEQARQRLARYSAVEEQIGTRLGQLQGTLFDYLGGIAQTGLQITSLYTTGGTTGTESRMATQADIDRFANQLPYDRESFMANAQSMLGQPYQQLLDLYSNYQRTNI